MNSTMMYRAQGKEIDLSKITRLYPAALVHSDGVSASVSLEWAEMKADKVSLEAYVLICDFDPVGEVPINRIELRYETKEELLEAINTIAQRMQTR